MEANPAGSLDTGSTFAILGLSHPNNFFILDLNYLLLMTDIDDRSRYKRGAVSLTQADALTFWASQVSAKNVTINFRGTVSCL